MSAKKIVLVGLFAPFMLTGCLMVPGPRGEGVALVPFLPPIVVLDAEPYYVHEGYHYYYRNDGWYYSHSRSGPWVVLPRDHYPREVRFRDGGAERNGGRNTRRQGR
jgi:hypothetical protein